MTATIVPVILPCAWCVPVVFWNLPTFPNTVITFPTLPKLPTINLPCIKIFGVTVSGQCDSPPTTVSPPADVPPKPDTPGGPDDPERPDTPEDPTVRPSDGPKPSDGPTTANESQKSETSSCTETSTVSDCQVSVSAGGTFTVGCSSRTGCDITGSTELVCSIRHLHPPRLEVDD